MCEFLLGAAELKSRLDELHALAGRIRQASNQDKVSQASEETKSAELS